MRFLTSFNVQNRVESSLPNVNKQHRYTGKETVALISWPWGVTVSNVERRERCLIIYAIDMHVDKPLFV